MNVPRVTATSARKASVHRSAPPGTGPRAVPVVVMLVPRLVRVRAVSPRALVALVPARPRVARRAVRLVPVRLLAPLVRPLPAHPAPG